MQIYAYANSDLRDSKSLPGLAGTQLKLVDEVAVTWTCSSLNSVARQVVGRFNRISSSFHQVRPRCGLDTFAVGPDLKDGNDK